MSSPTTHANKTREDAEARAGSTAASAGQQTSELKSSASEQTDGAAKTLRGAVEQGRELAGNVKGVIDKSVRDQPMATLALAAAVGFIAGAIWKS